MSKFETIDIYSNLLPFPQTSPLHKFVQQNSKHRTNNTILLSSIFTLPHLSPKPSHNNLSIKDIENELSLNTSNIQKSNLFDQFHHKGLLLNNLSYIDESKHGKISQKKTLNNLEKVFKDKFYADIENNIIIKQKKKLKFEDPLLKDRCIHMKKMVGFWKCLCDYSSPKFALERYDIFKKQALSKQQNNFIPKKQISPYNQLGLYKECKTEGKPLLYTNSLIHQLRMKRKINFN